MLAHHHYRAATAVILRSVDAEGQHACESYFAEFINELGCSYGNVRLVIEMRDGNLVGDADNGDLRVFAFDGSLTPVEMQAYVSLRMIKRHGPGSTMLLSSLVVEYAGYDPLMAERLMALPSEEILALPESLTSLLEEEPARWTQDSWLEGTDLDPRGRHRRHPLREWYLARQGGDNAAEMLSQIKRRYWRACVKALTPWLEERRSTIMNLLKVPLDEYETKYGGFSRPTGSGATIINREDLEYNNIVGMVGDPSKPLKLPSSALFAQILLVCRRAKSVRDAIAHMRPPKSSEVQDLIRSMDMVLADERDLI